jgi:tetratricopeptide (TPR) repeat protein
MAKAPPRADAKEGPTKGKLTGKDFDTLKSDYISMESVILAMDRKVAGGNTNLVSELKAKQDALAPILSDLWDFQRVWLAEMGAGEASGISGLNRARAELVADVRQKLNEAASYGDIYQSIGQELWVAQRLFSSANPEHRRVGVSLALQASQTAQGDAQNGWLAGRICEGYIWPQLDVADDKNPRSPVYAQTLLTECGNIFRSNDEWENVVRNFELLLAINPKQADWARAQIGMALEQMGDAKRALQYLRAIKATNDYPWVMRRIPRLERLAKGK